jgi:hypothetical protein
MPLTVDTELVGAVGVDTSRHATGEVESAHRQLAARQRHAVEEDAACHYRSARRDTLNKASPQLRQHGTQAAQDGKDQEQQQRSAIHELAPDRTLRKGSHPEQQRWSDFASEPSLHSINQPGEHVPLLPPTLVGCAFDRSLADAFVALLL